MHADAAGAQRQHAGHRVADVAVDVGVDEVLRRRREALDGGRERRPVGGAIERLEGAGRFARQPLPAQHERAPLARAARRPATATPAHPSQSRPTSAKTAAVPRPPHLESRAPLRRAPGIDIGGDVDRDATRRPTCSAGARGRTARCRGPVRRRPVLVSPHAMRPLCPMITNGAPGIDDADDVEAGGDEVHLVPHAGKLELQMRIVGQQRPAARRAAPGDDPVVRVAAVRARVEPLEAGGPRVATTVPSARWRTRVRARPAHPSAARTWCTAAPVAGGCRRTAAPATPLDHRRRVGGIAAAQPQGLGRAELGGQRVADELGLVVFGEPPRQQPADRQRIDRRPVRRRRRGGSGTRAGGAARSPSAIWALTPSA